MKHLRMPPILEYDENVLSGLKTIGQRLRWAREEWWGVSQEHLASVCGLSQASIAKIERDATNKPRLQNLIKLSLALSVDANWLESGDGQPFSHSAMSQLRLDRLLEKHNKKGEGDKNDLSSLAERLKWARNFNPVKTVSQQELAEMTGLSQGFISKVEKGATEHPRKENLSKIAYALRINLDWLEHGYGKPFTMSAKQESINTISSLIKASALDDEMIALLTKIVQIAVWELSYRQELNEIPENSLFDDNILKNINFFVPRD